LGRDEAAVDIPGKSAQKKTRRRGRKLMLSIYEYVLSRLADGGFEDLTFDKIAAGVGTGKASLYRRWTTPNELLLEALADPEVGYGNPDSPEKGDIRSDLIAIFSNLAESLDRPHGRATLLIQAHRVTHPDLFHLVDEMLIQPFETMTLRVLEGAAERGEVNGDVINERIAAIGAQLITGKYYRVGQVDEDDVIAIVDEVMMPIVTQGRSEEGTYPRLVVE